MSTRSLKVCVALPQSDNRCDARGFTPRSGTGALNPAHCKRREDLEEATVSRMGHGGNPATRRNDRANAARAIAKDPATTPVAIANAVAKTRSCTSLGDDSRSGLSELSIAMPRDPRIAAAASIATPVRIASGGNAGKMYTRHLPWEVEKKTKIATNQHSVNTVASGSWRPRRGHA